LIVVFPASFLGKWVRVDGGTGREVGKESERRAQVSAAVWAGEKRERIGLLAACTAVRRQG
jgi:hypothetical protein